MKSEIRYADLWALLRRLGYDCDRLIQENRQRICEHPAAGSSLTLAEHPPDQPVHPQTLYGVRLEPDNFGLLPRAELHRRTKANAVDANGHRGARRDHKDRQGVPGRSP